MGANEASRIVQQIGLQVGHRGHLTYYSIKRGALQHRYHVEGQSVTDICVDTLLRQPETVERYIDPGRHWHKQVQQDRRVRARSQAKVQSERDEGQKGQRSGPETWPKENDVCTEEDRQCTTR